MSWVEDIKEDFVIITGDGKEFRPEWLNANLAKTYNIAIFNFIDIPGSLVKRRQPKGRTYKLEIYFQGDDHLDVSRAFEKSADDPRTWTIRHPLYKDLKVHPSALLFDNSKMNVTKITGDLLETIEDTNPTSSIVPEEKIIQDKEDLDVVTADAYVNNNPEPTVKDINAMDNVVDSLDASSSRLANALEDAQEFRNKVNDAKNKITNATSQALQAIRAIQEVINAPARFAATLKARIDLIKDEFDTLVDSVGVLTSRADKFLFENNAGGKVTALTVAMSTPLSADDYGNKQKVLEVIESLLDSYNKYIETLDLLQTEDADELDSYIPDSTSMQLTSSLINFTVSNLFDIALNAKQERSIVLEEDSNLIILAHRFYGANLKDEHIDELILNNNIGINEHLLVKKGRILRYYV